ncbi:spermidine/putrescine transport system permease protein [Dongia mobilis]|uniref:Spermidine/putrescine transport system permease protein n=2 Tax=Dongia mobilis TaxID=578943 RepID=A0A4R6WH59_9PROT|nr:spermidine/putrescine transport system permease protein [Dongia mobilis]
MSDIAEPGGAAMREPSSPPAKPLRTRILQRFPWLRGYLLMSPTIAVMLAMLIVPVVALFVRSFWTQNVFEIDTTFTLRNYAYIFELSDRITYWFGIPFPLANPVYVILLVKSIAMSLAVTVVVILLAYPMAYFMAFRVKRHKMLWLILITIPIWTSYLLRVFAWKIMLGFNGVINSGLMNLGIIDKPLEFLLYNPIAVIITLAHAWVAFAILPIYVSLEKIDRSLLEAATDLGDKPWERFWHVTLPLSAPGTIATILLVFIPTVGDYVTPALVGGSGGSMIGNSIQLLFGRQNDAPLGSAVSVVMMATITAIVCLFLWLVDYRKIRARGMN